MKYCYEHLLVLKGRPAPEKKKEITLSNILAKSFLMYLMTRFAVVAKSPIGGKRMQLPLGCMGYLKRVIT